MAKIDRAMMMVAMLGTSAGFCGCNGDSAPPTISVRGGLIETVTARDLVLAPGRPHDISSADPEGTVQFRVLAAPAGKVERMIEPAVHYRARNGATIPAQGEVSAIKGTNALILTVRALAPLERDSSYTLEVVTGSGVQVADAERTGSDGRWRMRLHTGPNPQFVAVRAHGSQIDISFSEPVNLRDVNLSLANRGTPLRGCFKTWRGCVSKVEAPDLLTEEVSFKLENSAFYEDLELNLTGAQSNSIAPVQLHGGNWKVAADGAQYWQRPVTD